jgi:hypothetical protein
MIITTNTVTVAAAAIKKFDSISQKPAEILSDTHDEVMSH